MIFNFLRFFCFFLLILLSFGFFNIWLLWTNPRIVFFLFRWLLNSQYFPVKLGKHRHVLGGLTHFPPFKQGGEHIAENIKNHYDLFQLFFKGKNLTIVINVAIIYHLFYNFFLSTQSDNHKYLEQYIDLRFGNLHCIWLVFE